MSASLATAKGLAAEFSAELKDHAYGLGSFTEPQPLNNNSDNNSDDNSNDNGDDNGDNDGHGTASQRIQAGASAVLLEGDQVTIALDASGYTVTSVSSEDRNRFVGATFESFTGLLSAISPAFNDAMHRQLSEKLVQAMAADTRLVPDSPAQEE
ncbi:hypothetical protein LPJ72_003131 [Coemansia sp. Benny D160-2]|nr:hypothetical protein LPJ72_003131 [Coemansia sp. Benny D160-2]